MMLAIFWISVALIAYTYFLYPLLIVGLGKLRRGSPPPMTADEGLPTITMIIIAFNEEERIGDKLANCFELDYPPDRLEVCVVSDGSTDGTADILRSRGDIVFIEDSENRGKPYQLNRAMERSSSDLLVFSDARQAFDRSALRMLARNFGDGRVGCVSGELIFLSPEDPAGEHIGLYWAYEKSIRQAESDVDSTLGVTGAIYAIRRELAAPIPDDTILDDIEIPLHAFREGYRVTFEPEAKAYDAPSEELAGEFRRKTRTLAGNYQLFARNPWLLVPWKNRIFVQTVSHKFFRLLIPWAMLAVLLTTSRLPGSWFAAVFWSQAAAYAAGIMAVRSERLRRIRPLSLISVFLTLNAAAVAGLFRHLSGTADVRWKK